MGIALSEKKHSSISSKLGGYPVIFRAPEARYEGFCLKFQPFIIKVGAKIRAPKYNS